MVTGKGCLNQSYFQNIPNNETELAETDVVQCEQENVQIVCPLQGKQSSPASRAKIAPRKAFEV